MFVILKDIFLEAMPGRDKFYKIINENGLMLKPERRRHTTNSNHNYRKYKNLTQGLVITRPNQLWVADITYVDTDDGVMYIHHSDRGSQYCSNAYIDILNSINASISMTEDYKPTDNAIAERVNGIIKQEWLYRMKRPKNLDDACRIIRDIIDFYNNKRPHMSNGMKTPVQKRESYTKVAS